MRCKKVSCHAPDLHELAETCAPNAYDVNAEAWSHVVLTNEGPRIDDARYKKINDALQDVGRLDPKQLRDALLLSKCGL